jgi:cell division transport system permease protein
MRVQYVLTEVFNNIRRNALVVLGAILAVFISLFLVFGTLIFGEIARVNTLQWSEDVRVLAFLSDNVTDVDELRASITDWPEVSEVFYVSKPEAYQEALVLFENDEGTLRVIEQNPQLVPASLRIKPAELGEYDLIANRLQNLPGVSEVRSASDAVDQIAGIRDTLRAFSLALAIALGVAAVALIANTIHMAIYARREELEIMKLVGASNWFVRTPFILEGILEGLFGAALAFGVVAGLYRLGLSSLEGLPQWLTLEIDDSFLLTWGIFVLAFGALVGLIGSSLSLAFHRYIRT